MSVKNNKTITAWYLILSLLVGLIFSFYHWAIPNIWKVDNYSPLVLNKQSPSFAVDETIAYGIKTREILDGYLKLSDVYLWEYKNLPSPLLGEVFPSVIMAGLAKLGGGLTEGFMLADFLWPIIVFWGLSYFIFQLSKKAWLSIPGALIVMFFSQYLSYFPYLPSIVKIISQTLINGTYSEFIRSFHPQITFSLWLGLIIIIWQMLSQKKLKSKKLWFLGIFLGLLMYSYVFYWTYAWAWLGLILLWLIIKKQFKLTKDLFKTLAIAGILAGPYLINLYQFRQSPFSKDFIAGFDYYTPLSIKALILIIGLMGLNKLLIKEKAANFFWQSFYITGLILFLLAKPLGFTINDPVGHWLIRIVYPMAMINIMTILMKLFRKDYRSLGIILAILLLIYQGTSHWQYFKTNAEVFQLEPTKKGLFDWVNKNLPKDSVIVTASLMDNLYLPVYTSANVFIPRTQQTIATDEEGIERFLTAYKAVEIPEERIREMFEFTKTNKALAIQKRINYDDCGGTYFYFQKFSKNLKYHHYNCSVSKEHLEQILTNYEEIETELKIWKEKYRMDYWLWGPQEEEWAQVNPVDLKWQLVWQNKEYKLFKI